MISRLTLSAAVFAVLAPSASPSPPTRRSAQTPNARAAARPPRRRHAAVEVTGKRAARSVSRRAAGPRHSGSRAARASRRPVLGGERLAHRANPRRRRSRNRRRYRNERVGAPVAGSPATSCARRAQLFMNLLDSHRLLPCIAGLRDQRGAAVAGRRASSPRAPRPAACAASGLKACAVLLIGGCGLWWPGHFLGPASGRRRRSAASRLVAGLAWRCLGRCSPALTAVRRDAQDAAGVRRPRARHPAGRLRPLGVRDRRACSAPCGARRLGPGRRGLRPGHGAGRRSASSSSRAASCATVRGMRRCSSPRPAADPGRLRLGRRRRRRWRRPGPKRCCSSALVGIGRGAARGAAARRRSRERRAGAAADGAPACRPVDSLTQLPTRVYFEDRLAAAATKADANAEPAGAAVHRPRRLQAGQRHLRPLDRRPRPRAGRPAPEGDVARQGRRRARRRRRVPAPAHAT